MKKLNKIFSIVLTAAIMTSLLLTSAIPVSAGTQAWSEDLKTPSTTGMVLNTTINNASVFAQSPVDGALYAAVQDDASAATVTIATVAPGDGAGATATATVVNGVVTALTLTAGGSGYTGETVTVTISGSGTGATATGTVTGDVVSAVTLTAGGTNYGAKLLKSTDGGRTWSSFTTGGLPAPAVAIAPSKTEADVLFMVTAKTLYRSNDGGKTWATILSTGETFTALDVAIWQGRYFAIVGTDNTATSGGVLYWDENSISNNLVSWGAPSPFGAAVTTLKLSPTFGSDRAIIATGANRISVNINGGAWGAILPDITTAGTVTDIALPSDFNAQTNPAYFVVNGTNAIRVVGSTPVVLTTTLNAWTNIDVFGAFNAGNAQILLGDAAGNVAKSTNSGFSFSAVTLRSVAAAPATTAFVMFDKDYATNMKAYVLNASEALNVSIDGMTYFNQWSLVNETGTINGMDMAANGDIYARTVTANTLWRYFGGVWERIGTGLNATDMVFISPNYATDKTVMIANMGSANAIRVSANNGNSFAAMLSAPGSFVGAADVVTSVFVVNNSTVIVGSANGVITTNTSPFFWTEASVFGAGYNVTDIQAASTGDLLAAATNGTATKVAKSTDNGTTWTVLKTDGTGIIGDGAAKAFVAAADDYATTGNVFVAVDAALYRYPVAKTVSATNWQTVTTTGSTPSTGLVTAAGAGNTDEGNGVVYVSATDTTVDRVRGKMNASDALAAASSNVAQLFVTADAAGNKLWALGADGKIYNYVDTMAKGISGVAASDIVSTTSIFLGIVTTTNTATISWDAMPNATGYSYAVNTTKQTNLYTGAITGTTGATVTTADLTGLAADTTYFVSVWANAPVSSFMGTSSFTTVVGTPTPAMNLAPAAGAVNVPVKPTFDWADVPGAVSYEVWVDTKADFSTAVKATTPISAYAWTGADLANNTSYYWQVRAVTGTGTSGWVTSVFTTELAVEPPVTVTSTTQPNITLTQLPAPEAATPGYIWIIIAIGGILTVLVIVLIVRTRRVV
ncbi:MAG: beta strand repeat-containing protein [Dehalogenimonas sp.]